MKNILAEASVTEEFAKDFGVYDLNQFLNGLSLSVTDLILPTMDMWLSVKVRCAPSISLPTLALSLLLLTRQLNFPVKMFALN